MLRSFLILGIASGLAWAVEAKDPEVKTALAKLHAEAVLKSDVWTAMQCEAYGTRIGVRLSPILGYSDIMGEPLFAFPTDIRMVRDADSRVLVATRQSLHVVAGDGRPLALTVRYHSAETAAFSSDGNILGVASNHRTHPFVSVYNLATGQGWQAAVSQLVDKPGVKFMTSQAAVSCDGSAFAGAVGRTYDLVNAVILAHAEGTTEAILGLRQVHAVGPKGAWLIADRISRTATETDTATGARPVLRLGAANPPIPLHHGYAVGRDHVATLIEPSHVGRLGLNGKPAEPPAEAAAPAAEAPPAAEPDGQAVNAPPVMVLVTPEGACRSLCVHIGLGPEAAVCTLGDYLGVQSGAGAEPLPEIDILGAEVKPAGKQPPTFVLYSWEAVIKDPAQAQPVFSGPGSIIPCPTLPAAFYYIRGNELLLVNLTQNPPAESSKGSFGQHITSVITSNNRLGIATESSYIIADLAGQTLWSGKKTSYPYLNGPQWMVVGEGPAENRSFSAVNLCAPAAARKPMPLSTKPGQIRASIDPFGRFVSIRDAEGTLTVVNPADGNPFKTPLDPVTYRWWDFRDFPGRFGQYGHYGCRLYDKSQPWPDGSRGEWSVRDGLVVNGGVIVLDEWSQVWMGRRGGPYANCGTCPGAYSLLNVSEREVLLLNDDGQLVGRVLAGNKVQTQAPAALKDTQAENRGAWQLDEERITFLPPRSGVVCRWNDACRFSPLTLHSAPGATNPLTVVTRSLVLGMDNASTTLHHCAVPQGKSR